MSETVTVTNSLLVIDLDDIHPGVNARGQVRDVDELAMSIAALGQLQPIIVEKRDPDGFTIFDGHRRYAAMRQLGLPRAKAILRNKVDDADRLIQQLALSLTGKPFDPIAESDAVYELFWTHLMSEGEIAQRVGHSVAWVRGRLALRQATADERRMIAAGRMPVGDALAAIGRRRAERDGRQSTCKTSPARPKSAAEKCPACGGTGRAS